MKIVAINGSARGKAGNTNFMAETFLNGARSAGAETVNWFLLEKDIQHCKGCHVCWTKGPGQCVINDDMPHILASMAGADIILFVTPVYFENISGRLKVFMDRLTMLGSPHQERAGKQDRSKEKVSGPGLMMIASCGYADRDEFLVTSLWISRVASKMHMKLAGEIYAANAKFLTGQPGELSYPAVSYLKLLETAGKEIVADFKISVETSKLLEKANEDCRLIM
jgi:multimeric flavodoxin WrbA